MSTGTQPPTPPGWYMDGSGQYRYWDGSGWLEFTAPPALPAFPSPAVFNCGPPGTQPVPAYYGHQPQALERPDASGLYVAAAIINWIALGILVVFTLGIGIIAAAWYVPMTIYVHKGARDRRKHTTLAVCTLIFCSPISGILMLVEDSNNRDRPLAPDGRGV